MSQLHSSPFHFRLVHQTVSNEISSFQGGVHNVSSVTFESFLLPEGVPVCRSEKRNEIIRKERRYNIIHGLTSGGDLFFLISRLEFQT